VTPGTASLVEAPASQVAAPSPTPSITATELSDVSYSISVLGTQLVFNGTTYPQLRGSFFQRDSAYFAFRNVLDQLIATVKTQFYQIIVNRELVKVNEQSVELLAAQLKDQQNRFEAGTVPRFNVLQAEVAYYNQLPQLITAQNNLRISKLTLAKTLGLYFQPMRGEEPPLDVVGEMPYIPRSIKLADAIELGKERRPFLKQARANVLNQLQQVRAAAGNGSVRRSIRAGTIFRKAGSQGFRAPCQSGIAARSLVRLYNSVRSFQKPKSPTMMTSGRWNWRYNRLIPICSRIAS
jgi:outer membrane protein TolC